MKSVEIVSTASDTPLTVATWHEFSGQSDIMDINNGQNALKMYLHIKLCYSERLHKET